jgi:hypothetical protein
MRIAVATLFLLGIFAMAQSNNQNQSTVAPHTTKRMQRNKSAMGQQVNGSPYATVPPSQVGVNSPDYRPDFRGTELEKAYQQEEKTGWKDPNIIKSGPFDAVGPQ